MHTSPQRRLLKEADLAYQMARRRAAQDPSPEAQERFRRMQYRTGERCNHNPGERDVTCAEDWVYPEPVPDYGEYPEEAGSDDYWANFPPGMDLPPEEEGRGGPPGDIIPRAAVYTLKCNKCNEVLKREEVPIDNEFNSVPPQWCLEDRHFKRGRMKRAYEEFLEAEGSRERGLIASDEDEPEEDEIAAWASF